MTLEQTYGRESLDYMSSPTGVADDDGNIYIAETGASVVKKYDPQGNLIRVIGKRGLRPGQLNAPVELAVFDDVLYVSELGNDRISRFTTHGHFIDVIGEGELVGPRAVTLDEAGTIYALDEFSNRIVLFDQSGDKISECSPFGFFFPNDIFYYEDALYVTNTNAQNIMKLDMDCNVLVVAGSFGAGVGQYNYPRSIFVKDDQVYITDGGNNRIQVLDTNLNFLRSFGGYPTLFGPASSMVRNDGTIVVAETGRHQARIFSPTNLVTPIVVIGTPRNQPGYINAPGGISLDKRANELYVADTNNGRIQVFNFETGKFKRTFGTPGFGTVPGDLLFVNGVTVVGDLVYTASALNQIVVFDKRGNQVQRIGGFGTGPGQFAVPYDIQVDSHGNFYVADFSNNRVQKFDANWNFVQVIGAGIVQPVRIHIDSRDRLFVTDQIRGFVRVFNSKTGELITSIGGYGFEDGQLFLPHGVTMDKNEEYLVVTESGNNRISLFKNNKRFTFSKTLSQLGSWDTDMFFPIAAIQCGGKNEICISNTVHSTVKQFELDFDKR